MQSPIRTDALSWYPYSKKLEDDHTHITKYGDTVCAGKRVGDMFGLPRGLVPTSENDHRTVGHSIAVSCKMVPRNSEQVRVIEECKKKIEASVSFILEATTGFGKTAIASNLIAWHGRTTLVVVTKEDLMFQWRNELKKFLGLTDDEIGIAQQNKCHYEGKKIVLGMVHSLAKDKYGPEFKNHFGLVIWDEVHRMAAETFNTTAGLFPAKVRIGLSATPNRADGKEFLFIGHIGKVGVRTNLNKLPPKVIWQHTGWQMPKWMKQYKFEPGKLMHVFKELAKNQERNQFIVNFAYSAWTKDRNTIIFSDLLDAHLEPLFQEVVKRGVPEDQMAFYVGGMNEAQREYAKKHAKVLFATYQMTAEATDIPRLDTAVLATPRSNIIQPVGRILREAEEKKQPVVYDLVDDSFSLLANYMSSRRAQYYRLGASSFVDL